MKVNFKYLKKRIRRFFRKYRRLIALIIILIFIIFLISKIIGLFTGKKEQKHTVEETMTNLVTEYYEKKIKGTIFGINRYIVTIETMENNGFDVSALTNKPNSCKKNSYAYVITEDPAETDIKKIQYTIELYLDCANYQSK